MQPLIVANWKMQVNHETSISLARALVPVMAASGSAFSLVLCPSFVSISDVAREIDHSDIELGAQDVGSVVQGARTGDVSVLDLYALGCTHCIVGHSERRISHGERDEDVREKVVVCLKTGMIPILCVGETSVERARGITLAVIHRQLCSALQGIPMGPRTKIVIAYEPVWSLTPGTPATSTQIEEVFAIIRNELAELHIPDSLIQMLYGGSANRATVRGFLEHTTGDGFLIGSESQEQQRFIEFLNVVRSSGAQ